MDSHQFFFALKIWNFKNRTSWGHVSTWNSSETIKFPWSHMHTRKSFWKICTHVQPSTRSIAPMRRAQFYCRSKSLVCSNIWRAADWDFQALRSTVDCTWRVPFVMMMLSYLRDRERTKAYRITNGFS